MKQSFIEQVESHDLAMVRLSLSMELMLDPRGVSFCEMLSYADNKLPDLFEVHDGKTYSEDESDWNQELFFSVKNDLDRNFSKERLELYEKMSRVVLKEKIDTLNKEDNDRNVKQERKSQDSGRESFDNSDSEESIPWKWIALAGAVIAALIAIILGRNNN